jgi:DNA gyrase subunit B
LINALGTGSKDFNIDNLRYDKIVIMTDADVDGSHIRTLLLTFFNNHPFNQLIENGHLYLAQPPLFKVTKGTKSVYIKDERNLEEYIIKIADKVDKKIKKNTPAFEKFMKEQREKLTIQRFKGLGEMNPEELWQTTLNPENRTMLKVQYSKGTKDKSKADQKMIQILMGDDVAPRKEFITNNALNVNELDI